MVSDAVDPAVDNSELHVIVVGSSAGGLAALTDMFSNVLVSNSWCFVLAQHMSPQEPSLLSQLLDRATGLRVVTAVDGAPLEANVVYVPPPGFDVEIDRRSVKVVAPQEGRPWPNIDRLLISAAGALGLHAIGVVLSGTGDDGAAGVEAVEAAGGIVVIQDPDTTTFDSMPRAAFATGAVDLEVPASDIGPSLSGLLDSRRSHELSDVIGSGTELHDESLVEDIIATLLTSTGIDFSGYKRSTVRRQIARRQRTTGLLDLQRYSDLLRADSAECTALGHILLVTVTAFFRDASVWEALAVRLRSIVDDLDGRQLRLWVPGCASGEEAYTVAMLAADALEITHRDLSERIKIFATDLDEVTLEVGRRGRYSAAAVESIPTDLRSRWMNQIDGMWEVVPELRESIVFARHNIAFDPPFPKIDLISLRNTMIYFQSHLQERVLQLCQFALVPDGLLLLGKSERVSRTDAFFAIVDPDNRLYRRRPSTHPIGLPAGPYLPSTRIAVGQQNLGAIRRHRSTLMYQHLLKALVPPTLVIDDAGILAEVIGDVSPWCAVAEGPQTGTVADLLREPYRLSVRAMLSQLRFSTPDSVSRDIKTPDGEVIITATRLNTDGLGCVISFSPAHDGQSAGAAVDQPSDSEVMRISEELESTQEALQSTVEDLSTTNEELQAMNEELQASSEELQASSEEVQASNEELEATNEELTTLNQELQSRGTELSRANIDLENIQVSLTNGLVLLDRELKVTRYTPLAVRLFSLIPGDIGRPLPAVPTTIPVPDLTVALRATVATGESRLIELSSASRDLLLQTQPYVGSDSEILGAIVVVIDVSDITAERRRREAVMESFRVVTESIREMVWQRDQSGQLVMLTSRVESLFGLDRESVLRDPGLLLAAVHPDDKQRVSAVTASVDRNWQIEYRIILPDGAIRYIDESASKIEGISGDVLIGSAIDVTDRREAQQAADDQAVVLDSLMNTRAVGVLVLDEDGRIDFASASFADMVGHRASALIGTPMSVILEVDNPAPSLSAQSSVTEMDVRRITRPDGTSRPVTVEILETTSAGVSPRSIAVVHDISRLREISAELVLHEQFDQQTGLLTRAYFRSRTEAAVGAAKASAAVLWIDLDGFKEVNDRLGHRFGDVVLATIAKRLKRAAGRDDIVGRLGGDEFAILVSRSNGVDGIDALAHRVLAAVREPVPLDETLAFVSASVGVAIYPQDGADADALLHNADTAMYAAKQLGRDRHAFFTQELNNVADERAAMRHELATAVRNRDFELHYQPNFDVASGAIDTIEALVRWRRNGEMLTAAKFIDIAAETGQLRALGRIVLDRLDDDMRTLHLALGDRQPLVAVNLSATELTERDIVDRLLTWNPAGGFAKLCIEVTESILLDPAGRAIENLGVLRRLGATISVDDFGTGYSNLDLLSRLEPGVIKIDRSLLDRAAESGRGAKILDAAVQLAHALDAAVVIEGVSSGALMDRVRGLDATLAQGFHLAEPMPVDDVIALLLSQRSDPAVR